MIENQLAVPGFLASDEGLASLLLLNEGEATPPLDTLEALTALRAYPAPPDVTNGTTGPARLFDGASGIVGDDTANALLLPLSVSVAFWLEWDHDAVTGDETVIARGVDGSAVQYRTFEVRLSVPSPGTGSIRWVWQDRSGVEQDQAGGDFVLEEGYRFYALAREWVGDEFLLRYWVDGTLVSEASTSDISVGGGIDADVTVGCAGDGLGGQTRFLHGALDSLAVFSTALTTEQVRHIFERASLGSVVYREWMARQPIGTARSMDEDALCNLHQRVRSNAAACLTGEIELRAKAGRPDRAFGRRLENWERTLGLETPEALSISDRRQRVVVGFNQPRNLSVPPLLENLAPLYGVDESDIEIIEYDNVTRGIDPAAWIEQGDGSVLVDSTSGDITLRVAALAAYSTLLGGYAYRTAVKDETTLIATIEATSLANDDLFVGFANAPGTTLAGLKFDTSAAQIVNTLTNANVQAYTLPVTVRVYRDGSAVKARVGAGAEVTLGTPSAAVGYAQVSLVPISASVPGSARSARLSNIRVQQLDSRSPQCAYLFTDTAADLLGVRRQLLRQQPAHAHCAALVGRRTVRCDDSLHGCDSAPVPESQRDYVLSWLGEDLARAWAGVPVDLVSGEVLTAAGAATYDANVTSFGPFGDQALSFAAGAVDKWTLPSASSLNFTSTSSTAFLLVYYISSFALGSQLTLIGNREGADLNGFEVAIGTTGNLLIRFDSGAAAATELTLQAASTNPGWHALVVKYDHDTDTITAVNEIQAVTATFAASASSSTPTALGAYRALNTPTWRCGFLAVFEGDAAQALDPVATAVYAHRAWANLYDHPAELRRFLPEFVKPDVHWVGSTIDDVGLHYLSRENNADIVQGPYFPLTGPNVMSVAGTQAWATQSAGVVEMDTRSAMFILAVNLTGSTGGVFNNLYGNRTGTAPTDSGIELTISTSGRITFNADDATGAVVGVQLPSLLSAANGKHVYVVLWNATTGVITVASELESATGSFLGRDATSTGLFRIGANRGLVSATFNATFFAAIYDPAVETVNAQALAAALQKEF